MINPEEPKDNIIIIYKSYTPAHQRAAKKYYEQNKEEIQRKASVRNEKLKLDGTFQIKERAKQDRFKLKFPDKIKSYASEYYLKNKEKIAEQTSARYY